MALPVHAVVQASGVTLPHQKPPSLVVFIFSAAEHSVANPILAPEMTNNDVTSRAATPETDEEFLAFVDKDDK